MKAARVYAMILIVIAAISVATVSDTSAGTLCSGVDKDFLTRHVPFPFETVVETLELKDLDMCEAIIRVNGANAPLFVPATKDAVIAGDIFRNQTSLSRDTISQIDARSFKEYTAEIDSAVAFSYKPARDIKTVVYMITDPDCPFCERAKEPMKSFADENGVELRILFLPLPMHPDAKNKAVKGICANMSFADYLASRYSGQVCAEGESKVEKSIAIARKLGVNGTPTFISANGHRVSGFIPAQLNGLL